MAFSLRMARYFFYERSLFKEWCLLREFYGICSKNDVWYDVCSKSFSCHAAPKNKLQPIFAQLCCANHYKSLQVFDKVVKNVKYYHVYVIYQFLIRKCGIKHNEHTMSQT